MRATEQAALPMPTTFTALPTAAPIASAATDEIPAAPRSRRDPSRDWLWRSGAMLLAVAFYAFAAERLGFIATALLMLLGTFRVLGVPRRQAVLIAVLAAVIIYQVFGVLLRVPLPRGFLEW